VDPKAAVEEEPVAHLCPVCGEGRMVIVETLRAIPTNGRSLVSQEPTTERAAIDTS
jgi:C4-type Zn-finger protein